MVKFKTPTFGCSIVRVGFLTYKWILVLGGTSFSFINLMVYLFVKFNIHYFSRYKAGEL